MLDVVLVCVVGKVGCAVICHMITVKLQNPDQLTTVVGPVIKCSRYCKQLFAKCRNFAGPSLFWFGVPCSGVRCFTVGKVSSLGSRKVTSQRARKLKFGSFVSSIELCDIQIV